MTRCEYGVRRGVFLCYVLKRCVTEASALLAGVFAVFCTVYDRGGCALPRVQFSFAWCLWWLARSLFAVCHASVQGAHLPCFPTLSRSV